MAEKKVETIDQRDALESARQILKMLEHVGRFKEVLIAAVAADSERGAKQAELAALTKQTEEAKASHAALLASMREDADKLKGRLNQEYGVAKTELAEEIEAKKKERAKLSADCDAFVNQLAHLNREKVKVETSLPTLKAKADQEMKAYAVEIEKEKKKLNGEIEEIRAVLGRFKSAANKITSLEV